MLVEVMIIWLELRANDLHTFHSSCQRQRIISHLLMQSNPERFDIPVPAYAGCPGILTDKRVWIKYVYSQIKQ